MDNLAEILEINKITNEDIDFACNRLEAFMLIHRTRNGPERQKAIDTMISSLGLNQSTLITIRKRLEKIYKTEWEPALLGVLVGLWIHENKEI